MIEEHLATLGFSEKEIRVYLLIFEQRRILPSRIAKETGINRATVYSVTQSLLDKGYISEDVGVNSRKYFIAKSPQSLVNSFLSEKKILEERLQIAQRAAEELEKKKRNPLQKLPKLRFIPENKIEEFLYEQTPYWEASMRRVGDTTWWGFQDVDFPTRYADWISWYWKRADSIFNLKLISADSSEPTFQELKKKHLKRKLASWSANPEFTSTLWVQGEYIVMLVLQQKPNYLIEIHDVMLAENLRQVFKGIWESGIEKR